MNNFKIVVAYNGSDYKGWQRQPKTPTIQGDIERALKRILNEEITIHGAGRTDAGVHAFGQVAHFTTTRNISATSLKLALNRAVSDAIEIKSCDDVSNDFHARYCAKGKTYEYRIKQNVEKSPFESSLMWLYPRQLDTECIRQAMASFIGTHDFSAFTASGSDKEDKVRTIWSFELKEEGDDLIFTISGNGFLYNMVRIIIGTLVRIGEHKLQVEEVKAILLSPDRSRTKLTAPPSGLYLVKVHYE